MITNAEIMKRVVEEQARQADLHRPKMIQEFKDDPNNLANWFPKLEASGVLVPKTVLVDIDYDTVGDFVNVKDTDRTNEFLKRLDEAVSRRGYPCFLRSGIMSAKHSWKDSCYVTKESNLKHHVLTIIHENAMACGASMPTCFAVRELIETVPAFTSFWGNMPITAERRYFIRDGKVQCHHPYWPAEAFKNHNPPSGWNRMLEKLNYEGEYEVPYLTWKSETVAKDFPGYWSLDWLKSNGYGWYAIDMAEGKRSYHWKDCPHAARNSV